MKQVILKGTYIANSRGRGYLLSFEKTGVRKAVRVQSRFQILNGSSVTLIGQLEERQLIVQKVISHLFPRK